MIVITKNINCLKTHRQHSFLFFQSSKHTTLTASLFPQSYEGAFGQRPFNEAHGQLSLLKNHNSHIICVFNITSFYTVKHDRVVQEC